MDEPRTVDQAAVMAIERPHKNLLTLYALQSLLTLIAAPFVFIPFFFRYHTLRYRFDDEGIHARWGILFRREIYLTYRRIQDIHVSRNLFERWLGIGKVEVQTASGSSSAELTIEGMQDYESVRDFLYLRMRGTRAGTGAPTSETAAETPASGGETEMIGLLTEIRDELDGARRALEAGRGS